MVTDLYYILRRQTCYWKEERPLPNTCYHWHNTLIKGPFLAVLLFSALGIIWIVAFSLLGKGVRTVSLERKISFSHKQRAFWSLSVLKQFRKGLSVKYSLEFCHLSFTSLPKYGRITALLSRDLEKLKISMRNTERVFSGCRRGQEREGWCYLQFLMLVWHNCWLIWVQRSYWGFW